MSDKHTMTVLLLKLAILSIWLSLAQTPYAHALDSVIIDGEVEGIKGGDPASKIFQTFKPPFHVSERKLPPHNIRYVVVYQGKKEVVSFEIHENRVFMINIYRKYHTLEGIGPGSTLGQAVKAYGKGRLTPTDQGYLLGFEKPSWLSLLLNNKDIPENLRDIPDDVLEDDVERKILSMKKIRVVAVQIFQE